MPAPLTPKTKLISLPMALQPTSKAQKDIAEEYVALASADPPGARAIHTRTISTSSRETTATTSSARSSCSSDNGDATQPPKASSTVDNAPSQRSARSRAGSQSTQASSQRPLLASLRPRAGSQSTQASSPRPLLASLRPRAGSQSTQASSARPLLASLRPRAASQSSQQSLRPSVTSSTDSKNSRLSVSSDELRVDVGPIIHTYSMAFATMSKGRLEQVKRTSDMFSTACKNKRRELLALAEVIRSQPSVSHAWEGTEVWEALYVSHCSKIRDGLHQEQYTLLFNVGKMLLEETWRSFGVLVDVCARELAAYNKDADIYAYLRGAQVPAREHQEIVDGINHIIDGSGTSTRNNQQSLARNLLTRFRGLSLQRKGSKNKKTEEDEDDDFELIENFNLSAIGDLPALHRRTASEIVLDSPDNTPDHHILELNLSLRASRIIFTTMTTGFKGPSNRYVEPRSDVIRDDKGLIMFCTAKELVRRLTDRYEVRDQDTMSLLDAFFMFFREFMQPAELLAELRSRFEERVPDGLNLCEQGKWTRYQIVVKLHVVRMLGTWLDRYYLAAHDSHLLEPIRQFIHDVKRDPHLPEHAAALLVAHFRCCLEGTKGKKDTFAFESIVMLSTDFVQEFKPTEFQPYLPILVKAIEKSQCLTDVLVFCKPGGAEELARAFTAIESGIFHRCRPMELMACTEKQSHPVFDKMKRWSQAINLFVSQCILERRDMDARVQSYELFVEVAVACQRMRNYSSAMSFYLALEASRITRITQMMNLVSERHKAMFAGLKAFFDFSGSKQWQNYRDNLRYHHGPAVPLLVSVKADIIKIRAAREIVENKYKSHRESDPPTGKLIDIQMYKKLREIVRELESCYAEYELPASGVVFNWVLASVRIFEQLDYATFDQKYTDLSKEIQSPPMKRQDSWNPDELWSLGSWS